MPMLKGGVSPNRTLAHPIMIQFVAVITTRRIVTHVLPPQLGRMLHGKANAMSPTVVSEPKGRISPCAKKMITIKTRIVMEPTTAVQLFATAKLETTSVIQVSIHVKMKSPTLASEPKDRNSHSVQQMGMIQGRTAMAKVTAIHPFAPVMLEKISAIPGTIHAIRT